MASLSKLIRESVFLDVYNLFNRLNPLVFSPFFAIIFLFFFLQFLNFLIELDILFSLFLLSAQLIVLLFHCTHRKVKESAGAYSFCRRDTTVEQAWFICCYCFRSSSTRIAIPMLTQKQRERMTMACSTKGATAARCSIDQALFSQWIKQSNRQDLNLVSNFAFW